LTDVGCGEHRPSVGVATRRVHAVLGAGIPPRRGVARGERGDGNAGIAITVIMMGIHGTETVLGTHVPEAVPWIAGLGHTLLTVGLILLFVLLGKRLDKSVGPEVGEPEAAKSST
jgi:Protein of unknown function (DUF2871)